MNIRNEENLFHKQFTYLYQTRERKAEAEAEFDGIQGENLNSIYFMPFHRIKIHPIEKTQIRSVITI